MNPSPSQVMQQESLLVGRRELIRLTNEILSGRFARGLMVDLGIGALEWSSPIRNVPGIGKKER